MSELSNESIRSASFVTARSHISASNSHSSYSQPSFGDTTQIEPRVVAYEAALALKREREAARLAAKAPTTEEVAALFTRARRHYKVQDARLIITSTHFPKDTSQNSSIVPLPYKATRRVTFGVIQQAQDVDVFLHLPPKDAYTVFDTGISCQIIYDPGRDHCLLVNHTESCLRLTNFSSSPAVRVSIRENKSRLIQPGMWRISIDDDAEDSGEYHLAEFWLLGRQFDVTIQTADRSSRAKRGIDDGAEENANKRRKRNSDLTGTTSIQPISKSTIESRPAAIGTKSTDAQNPPTSSFVTKISGRTTAPLLDLEDGDTAVIRALRYEPDNSQSLPAAKGPVIYDLRRVKEIAATPSASIFTCKHSLLSGPVVAKVLRYKRDEPDEVRKSLFLWKTEKTTLKKLKHRSIVALKAFDGRMLAMYLERLPDSLYRGKVVKLPTFDIFRIMHDISSALVYLKTVPIIHNDIKPLNITYDRDRGAVLIDFGLATRNSEFKAGGTRWYVPPDLIDENSRGLPGDVWALGITILYLLGKIQYPDSNKLKWDMHGLKSKDNEDKMEAWLEHISEARAKLSPINVGTRISHLESIVFNMLERDSELRFSAEEILSALDQ